MAGQSFTSLDYADADLYDAVTARPSSAIPLEIPLKQLKPKPDGSPTVLSPGEKSLIMEEQAALQEQFRQEQLAKQAREEEITRRAQAQRDEIAKRVSPADPSANEPRVTNQNPSWEQPSPSRQPSGPSPASPAPTPATSGARQTVAVDVLSPPTSAAPRQPLSGPDPTPTAKPSSLPVPGGFKGIGVGAGVVDFAFRVVQGQPPGKAAVGGVATGAGTAVGAAVGSVAGPVGSFVGGAIGGFVAGRLADAIYDAAFPPGTQPAPDPKTGPSAFQGGQTPKQGYNAVFENDTPEYIEKLLKITGQEHRAVSGPIVSVLRVDDNYNGYVRYSNYKVSFGDPLQVTTVSSGLASDSGQPQSGPKLVKFIPFGTPDPTPDLDPGPGPIPTDNRSPNSYWHPGNQEYAPPSAYPGGGNPAPNNYAPGGISSGGSQRGDKYDWVPPAALAPGLNGNPNSAPSNLGGNLPSSSPGGSAGSSPGGSAGSSPGGSAGSSPGGSAGSSPGSSAGSSLGSLNNTPFPNSTPGQSTKNFGDENAKPIPLGSGGTVTLSSSIKSPSGLPDTKKSNTPPDGLKDKSPNTKPGENKQPDNNTNYDDLLKKISEQAAILAGITPILQQLSQTGIGSGLTKKDVEDAAGKGVCNTLKPGGCSKKANQELADKIDANGNNLDKLNALLNTFDLLSIAGLGDKIDLINNKLGDLLPNGGISGFLKRFSKWFHLDRALNILTFVMTLQNAYFLCDSLKVVTLQMIADCLHVIGITDHDGNNLDLTKIINGTVEKLFQEIIGVKNLEGIKKEWKALNRIYQSATNIMFALQNMVWSITTALDTIGSWNAQIGNALKRYGVVGHNAFGWMNVTPNFHNKFFTATNNLMNVVASLDMVAQSILQGRQAIDDIGKQKEELDKSLAEAKEGLKPPEHKPTAEANKKAEQSSKSPPPSAEDIQKLQD